MNTKTSEAKKKSTDFIKLIIESGYPVKAKAKVSDKDIIDKPILEDALKARMLAMIKARKVLFY